MEVINSFFSNLKDKVTNPFFGTLILVWLTRNWKVIYGAFTFDESTKQATKLKFITDYFKRQYFWEELWTNVGTALAVMLGGYLLIVLTRIIVNWVEYWLMPRLNDKIVSSLVAPRKDFDEVKKERDVYAEQYETQRKQVRELSKQYDEMTKIAQEQLDLTKQLTIDKERAMSNNSRLTTENRRLEKGIKDALDEVSVNRIKDRLLTEDNKHFKNVFLRKDSVEEYEPIFLPHTILNIATVLSQRKLLNKFFHTAEIIRVHGAFDLEGMDEFKRLELVTLRENIHVLTLLGNILLDSKNLLRQPMGKLIN